MSVFATIGAIGMQRITKFVDSWTFIAIAWAGLIAYALVGGV